VETVLWWFSVSGAGKVQWGRKAEELELFRDGGGFVVVQWARVETMAENQQLFMYLAHYYLSRGTLSDQRWAFRLMMDIHKSGQSKPRFWILLNVFLGWLLLIAYTPNAFFEPVYRFIFFLSGSSSSSTFAYNVSGCVFSHAFVNSGSFLAFSAYLSNASLGSSSLIELSGTLSMMCFSLGADREKGVVAGKCGRRGSRALPDAVDPMAGCRAAEDWLEPGCPLPGMTMLSPE